jgi:hypothetical protein
MNNIAINTQGVYTEAIQEKRSWLLSWRLEFCRFTGALIGLAMLSLDLAPVSSFFNRWSYCDYIDCI